MRSYLGSPPSAASDGLDIEMGVVGCMYSLGMEGGTGGVDWVSGIP